MYIPPFLAGVLCTILGEIIVIIGAAVIVYRKNKKK